MSQVKKKGNTKKKPKQSPPKKEKREVEVEHQSSVESKDLSALGGGNMRNPSSSDPSSDYSDNAPEAPDIANKSNLQINKGKQPDNKRPSVQFLEQLNLTDAEIENLDLKKKIVPVYFGNEEKIKRNKARRMTNKVRTTKYTWWTWAPLSLLMQFKRAANIYFLFISILTLMPFSSKSPASMIGTFSFVLFVTMLKEAFENYLRYKSDIEANNRKSSKFNYETNEFEECAWKDIRVGDMLRVDKDDKFPADLLLIYTPNVDGLVFVDTSNLDGETNLKDKMCGIPKTGLKELSKFQGKIFCDAPNHLLDEWDAEIMSEFLTKKNTICDVKNLLLRDCILKNTEFCIGIAINLGKHTKIMMNSKKPKQKVSHIMKKMNYLLYSVFAFQFMIIATFATLSCFWQDSNAKSLVYLDLSESVGFGTWIVQLLTYWVTFSHMIPISLYVIIEMLKLIQAYLINKDIEMYSFETENYAKCNNSDLIEELGQVEFIFSDKTGTLTMNKMVLKKCSIQGVIYGDYEEHDEPREGICESSIKRMRKHIRKDPNHPHSIALRGFLIILGVCHTVVCDRESEDPGKAKSMDNPEKIVYQSSSPDELALVTAAKDIGFELVGRSSEGCEIYNKILNTHEEFKIICEFPFTSDRKRMSVILEDNGKYYLYSKGADSVMLPRIRFEVEKDGEIQKTIEDNLHKFATEGLRVLVIGFKELSNREFNEFMDKYDRIRASKSKSKDEELERHYDQMESKLEIIGCTAIEDKLQDGVPETIGLLRQADINIWMLTGDKMETAIEIAKSCNLFDDNMTELMFSFDSLDMITQTLDSELKYLELKELFEEDEIISVVVDGSTLLLIFQDPKVTDNFFKLCRASKSVVCCRVSPKQKSDIVDNYMKSQSGICIAIGDGANDVPMIMQANIGIGIRGLEGTQAVRTADFAINQFSHLQKLLLVHGRWGYKRVAYMICYYFYKNIVLALCEIYFHLYNGFSGQIFFLDWLPLLYNSFFTSFPCLFTFSLEQDATVENSYLFPILYKAGRKQVYFNIKVFWKWILFSIWHGLASFYLTMLSTRSILSDGRTSEHWYSSTIAFTIIVHLVTGKLFIESIFWNWLSVLMAGISILVYYIILVIGSSEAFSFTFQQQATGLLVQELGSFYFWMLALIGPFVCLLPDLTYKFIVCMYWPTPADIIVAEQKGKRELINKKAKERAKKRRANVAYQPTGRARRAKGDAEGENDEEFEEEEEEEESEVDEEEQKEMLPPPVTPKRDKNKDGAKKKRNLGDYVKDQDEEFDSLGRKKGSKDKRQNHRGSKEGKRKSKRAR